jgi:hypothetical protein
MTHNPDSRVQNPESSVQVFRTPGFKPPNVFYLMPTQRGNGRVQHNSAIVLLISVYVPMHMIIIGLHTHDNCD